MFSTLAYSKEMEKFCWSNDFDSKIGQRLYKPSAEFKAYKNKLCTDSLLSIVNMLQNFMTKSCDNFARISGRFMDKRNQKSREDGLSLLPDKLLACIFYFTLEPLNMSSVCRRF